MGLVIVQQNRYVWKARRKSKSTASFPPTNQRPSIPPEEYLLPIWPFNWAVDRLKEGYKVTSSSGLKGGRPYLKSQQQAWDLVSIDDMLKVDWHVYLKRDK